jgi:hypothetical protein
MPAADFALPWEEAAFGLLLAAFAAAFFHRGYRATGRILQART